ncbi:unnamed protein product [Parnassius mnemosyne]|uniref:PiggyBac transposable element-derived protein domain-containing protein n=1 Tax=Parnassius mnemosyne TaxID=213953 RepID=A0AAV1LXX0_9NEOP
MMETGSTRLDHYYKRFERNSLKIEKELTFSIDEMIVPYKGTRAGSRKQYVQNKPKKWGFKMFVRAGVSGIVYDFFVYEGEDTFWFTSFTEEEKSMGLGAKVAIPLAKSICQPDCKILCFDNFFTSIELTHPLRNECVIFSLGTAKFNRLRGAQEEPPTNIHLKKKGRGSHA